MSTASSGEALQSLGTALRSALARVRSTDDLYDVTCGVLRHHLGPEILLSVYEEDAGRVWLRAQRGYAETTNSYPLGDGLISEALRDERSIGIVTGAASNLRSGPLGVGVETLVVSPFASGRIRGAIVLASRETLDPPIREAADDVARVVEQALAALPASELERPTGSRWLSRSFLRLASTRDRHALFELTARLVGEVLDVDCVQAAEGNDELVVVATCHAGRERLYPLSDAAVNSLVAGSGGEPFRLGAESWNGELSSGASLEGRCEVIGLPMRAGNELLGFLVASSRTLVEIQAEAFEQAELLVAHASTALSTLRMLERSERAAVTDGLTGLWNHRRFHETSLALIEAAPEVEFALVLADLDDFKELNDRRGHVAGDDALRAVAGVLRRGMRPGDSVFRLGGEEFALLLPSTSRPNARTVCRRLQRTLETLDLGGWRLTLSFGVARSPDDGSDLRTLMQAADAALYEAKRLGKDRITMASERLVARRSPTMKARTRRGFEQMRQLEALVARLGSARTPRSVTRELLAGLREVVPGECAVVWSVEAGALTDHALAGSVDDPVIERSLRGLGAEALADARTRLRDDEPGSVPSSALVAPLGSPPLAVLALAAHEDAPFDRDDLRLVEVAARVAGLALANALRTAPTREGRSPAASLAVALARCETLEEVGRAACEHTAARVRADRLSLWQRIDPHRTELVHAHGVDAASIRRLGYIDSVIWRDPGTPEVVLLEGPPPALQLDGVAVHPRDVPRGNSDRGRRRAARKPRRDAHRGAAVPARRDHGARGHHGACLARAARAPLDGARRGQLPRDGRVARQRARGPGSRHVATRARDRRLRRRRRSQARDWGRRRSAASSTARHCTTSARSESPRSSCASRARSTRRRPSRCAAIPSSGRASSSRYRGCARSRRSCGRRTSGSTAWATPMASSATRSRSSRASSRCAMRSTRWSRIARTAGR